MKNFRASLRKLAGLPYCVADLQVYAVADFVYLDLIEEGRKTSVNFFRFRQFLVEGRSRFVSRFPTPISCNSIIFEKKENAFVAGDGLHQHPMNGLDVFGPSICYVALELSPSNHPHLYIPSRKTQNLHLSKQASKAKPGILKHLPFLCVSLFKNPTNNNMALRSMGYWKSIASRLSGTATYATSTPPKLKSYAPSADQFGHHYLQEIKHGKNESLIALSISLGLYTAKHQVLYAPNVRVRKKTRETIPEVVDPDRVVGEADKFIRKSFFRKVAHVQEYDHNGLKFLPEPRAETLQEVGVDPKLQL
uniref:Uncharacterized protein n=1 Tax=Salix viminalis TaxID=40686 RepID=A0A6N2MXP4_SALVM